MLSAGGWRRRYDQGDDYGSIDVGEQGVPECHSPNVLGCEVRVRDLERHADGQRQVGEVQVRGRVIFVEVDPADGTPVVGTGIAKGEDGMDQSPGQGNA